MSRASSTVSVLMSILWLGMLGHCFAGNLDAHASAAEQHCCHHHGDDSDSQSHIEECELKSIVQPSSSNELALVEVVSFYAYVRPSSTSTTSRESYTLLVEAKLAPPWTSSSSLLIQSLISPNSPPQAA